MKKVLLPALLLILPAAAFVVDADRSPAIFPHQEIPLRFDHSIHLAQGMKCVQCHDVDTSTRAADRNIPPEATCADCHDIEAAKKGQKTDPPASCQTCHPGFQPTAMLRPRDDLFPTPNLKFNHAVHLKRGVACATCHGEMKNVALATRAQLPKMETCLGCHKEGGEAPGKCTTCHLSRPDGMLTTLLPGGARLMPEMGNPYGLYHGPSYFRTHGPQATTQRQLCSNCHAESDCLVCHAGTVKNLKVHPNDWITLHPVAAKQRTLECSSCHNYSDFCVNCHARSGVAEEPPELQAKPEVKIHPDGWFSTAAGGRNDHAIWASRDISTCVSCHREQSCLQCHATTARQQGAGAKVHPLGFQSEAAALCHRNERVCLKCHAPTDPLIQAACR